MHDEAASACAWHHSVRRDATPESSGNIPCANLLEDRSGGLDTHSSGKRQPRVLVRGARAGGILPSTSARSGDEENSADLSRCAHPASGWEGIILGFRGNVTLNPGRPAILGHGSMAPAIREP